jgi:AraC family transcriptional regulator
VRPRGDCRRTCHGRDSRLRLEPLRFETRKSLLIAGLRDNYAPDRRKAISRQWQRFAGHLGRVPGQVGRAAYGVVSGRPGGFAYLSGVEVSALGELPPGFAYVKIPAGRYAVFAHRDDVSTIGETCDAIFGGRFAPGKRAAARAADFFLERYGEEFDAANGRGGIEIWVPVKESGALNVDDARRISRNR